MDKKGKVGFIHSMVLKVVWSIITGVVVTWVILVLIFLPRIRNLVSANAENYMYDMAVVHGEALEKEVATAGTMQALSPAALEGMFQGVGIKGADSSYAYVTDGAGIMLYHPTADKIGQPVENEVVKGLVEELASGKVPEPGIVTYDYRGSIKYASYYVGKSGGYILVISADEKEIFQPVTETMGIIWIAGAAVLLICGAVGFVLAKLVIKPINMLTGTVRRLAGLDFRPDATQEKLNRRRDESGHMSRAISSLRQELVQVSAQIKEQSGHLYSAADTLNQGAVNSNETVEQVERAIGEIADGASSQAEETQKATENVILIGNMVEEVGSRVEKLNDNAETMQQASVEAMNTLKQLNDTNIRTQEAIDKIYEQTHTTNESALKIREATTMISSIAEETNLLSLNASIEAARAGEQGRGFAVVASQIQKLAEQSNESARQIEEIIDSLIRDSEEAVATMDGVKDIIVQQSANVDKTDSAFREVKKGMDISTESIQSIADDIEKLDKARINVVDVVQNLTAIAQQNAASTQETSASATEVGNIVAGMADQAGGLKSVAEELDKTMSVFKL